MPQEYILNTLMCQKSWNGYLVSCRILASLAKRNSSAEVVGRPLGKSQAIPS